MPRHDPTATRLRGYLQHYDAVYGRLGVWRHMAALHAQGRDTRPPWLYLTMQEVTGVLARIVRESGMPQEQMSAAFREGLVRDLSVLPALGAWRIGQGVYRVDPSLLAALWTTPVDGPLPGEMLLRLPQWCVYVETPVSALHLGRPLLGYWAYLDLDHRTGPELRLLPDIQPAPGQRLPAWMPLGVPLVGTLQEGLAVYASGAALPPELTDWARGAVSVLLYLCSTQVDYDAPTPPARATAQEVRRSGHTAQAAPREWRLGGRLGAALRGAGSGTAGAGGAGLATHYRSPHWQTVWLGSRSAPQTPASRWIPPLIVRPDRAEEARPVVVRKVEPD